MLLFMVASMAGLWLAAPSRSVFHSQLPRSVEPALRFAANRRRSLLPVPHSYRVLGGGLRDLPQAWQPLPISSYSGKVPLNDLVVGPLPVMRPLFIIGLALLALLSAASGVRREARGRCDRECLLSKAP